MSHESLQKYSVNYRCSGDITNLKIRVKLKEIDHSNDSTQWTEKTFRWQEKAFSKTEIEYYKDEGNCLTDLEKNYHLDVLKLESDPNLDIFTYTNEDNFNFNETSNHLNFTKDCEQFDKEYNFTQSVKTALRNATNYNFNFDVMFIVADLGEYVETTWLKNEIVLCTVKFDDQSKVLSIFPDFTTTNGYIIETRNNGIKKFKYYVENVSEPMPEETTLKEKHLIKKINNYKLLFRNPLDWDFACPPKNKLQVHLIFELLWAKQFEHDVIYVQYFIDLPPNWSCESESQLQGMTQTCHTKGDDRLAHFGHVFDLTLNYNIEELEKTAIPQCPYIYCEIISKDRWNRYRTDGLTYKNLPVAKPGTFQFELQCFRFIPNSISGQLRRFFIGDCSNIEDITWIGVQKHYDSCVINKYGTQTVGTGLIGLRTHVLHHSHAFLEKYSDNGLNNDIFDKLNSSSLVKSVEQVLQAFKRARKNMIDARKNL